MYEIMGQYTPEPDIYSIDIIFFVLRPRFPFDPLYLGYDVVQARKRPRIF
jgi:hypothetical protein